MGNKKILAVGCSLRGAQAESVLLWSDRSLLDGDIVLFEPSLGDFDFREHYNGKPLLTETSSVKVQTMLSHWNSELRAALSAGKLIVIFLTKPQEAFAYTGEKQHSGTGRSQRTTNIVAPVTSYTAVPFLSSVSAKSGSEIAVNGKAGFFIPFWTEFRDYCAPYEVWIDGKFSEILLHTKTGGRAIGAAFRQGGGAMLLVPPFRYRRLKTGAKTGSKRQFLTETQFGNKLVTALVALSHTLATEEAKTPPPNWVTDAHYRLAEEEVLALQVRDLQRRLEEVQEEKRKLDEDLVQAGSLRRLLYEQGNQLEEAILEALRLMGFDASPFNDGDSEFDAVFTSREGRFLGEAEGRDNRPINIEKFSQLERNLHEEFEKGSKNEYAKGVLFGNAFRLTAPTERKECFTEKCFTAARRTKAALIRTPDMFEPARYLKSREDKEYARLCREAIFAAEGVVVTFPPIPASQPPTETGTHCHGEQETKVENNKDWS